MQQLAVGCLFFSMVFFMATAHADLRKHRIIPKVGFYEMDTANTGNSLFDTKSKNVYGFEYEYRFANGLSIGAEHMHIENTYVDAGLTRELKVNIAFFDAKYYFNNSANSHWMPYVGLGAGYAFGRATDDRVDGFAYQVFAGITYEWERMGLYVQYKYMDLEVESSFRYISPSTGRLYDLSGTGLFTGLIVKF